MVANLNLNSSLVRNARQNQVSFGYNVVLDIGSSTSEGSLKLSVLSRNNERIKKATGVLNSEGRYFKDNDDFVDLIAKKIEEALDPETLEKLAKNDPDDNELDGVAALVPSYVNTKGIVHRFTKFMTGEKTFLADIDLSGMKEKLVSKGVNVSDKFNLKVFRDIVGILVSTVDKLADKLKPGLFLTVVTTGGGAAMGDIKVFDPGKPVIELYGNYLIINDTEARHLAPSGSAAPNFVENVCKTMNLDSDATSTLVKYGSVKEMISGEDLTLTYESGLRNEQVAAALVKTGLYTLDDSPSKPGSIKLKFNHKAKDKLDKAIDFAVSKYVDALTILALQKINQGANGLILTGTMALKLNKFCQGRYNKGLSEMIHARIVERGQPTSLLKQGAENKFQVICGDDFAFNDNSECGNIIFKTDFLPNDFDRNTWLTVKLDDKKA